MQTVKMSLIDDDSVVQCQTAVHLDASDNSDFRTFLEQIREELVIGQSATLEITDPPDETIILNVSYADL